MGSSALAERFDKWKQALGSDLRKRWWWVFIVGPVIGFVGSLLMHRLVGATNKYIDTHLSLSALKPIVGMASAVKVVPAIGWAGICAGAILLVLVVHAYFDTRPRARTEAIIGNADAASTMPGEGDPQVIIECEWPRVQNTLGYHTVRKRPLVARNVSDKDAFNVQVQPLTIRDKTTRFDPIPRLTKTQPTPLTIHIEDAKMELFTTDLEVELVQEWNHRMNAGLNRGDIVADCTTTVTLVVEYTDFVGRKQFVTKHDLTYDCYWHSGACTKQRKVNDLARK